MKKLLYLILIIIGITIAAIIFFYNRNPEITYNNNKKPNNEKSTEDERHKHRLKKYAAELKIYNSKASYNQSVAFLIDMSLPSGKARFFVYDLKADTIITTGLVAHGSCNTAFATTASFSNTPNCGCSSLGKYKVGYSYNGQFGKAYKLHGLDKTNDNAFKRYVVLHGYSCVPDREVDPLPICNSLGCPMVSYKFLERLTAYIDMSKKPILLWIYQ